MTPAEQLERLFRGRTDIWFDCIGTRRGVGNLLEPLWRAHLEGVQPIGSYNLLPDSTVWWSATDIDLPDLSAVQALARVWRFYGIRSFMETSRSKGFHLWIFHPAPISAEVARNAWLWVHEMADVPPTEVYPKQTDGAAGFGNCIRLPYPGQAASGRHMFFDLEMTAEIPLSGLYDAVSLEWAGQGSDKYGATHSPTEEAMLAVANRKPKVIPITYTEVANYDGRDSASGQYAARVYRGEVDIPTGDRDNTFYALACYCLMGVGLSVDDTRYVIERVYNEQLPDKKDFKLMQAIGKIRSAQHMQIRRATS